MTLSVLFMLGCAPPIVGRWVLLDETVNGESSLENSIFYSPLVVPQSLRGAWSIVYFSADGEIASQASGPAAVAVQDWGYTLTLSAAQRSPSGDDYDCAIDDWGDGQRINGSQTNSAGTEIALIWEPER